MSDHVNAVRLRLTNRLRAARQALGLTQSEVAAALLWSHAKYSRLEGGNRGVAGSDLLLLMPALQIPEEERPLLLAMARQSKAKGAYDKYSTILGPGAIEYFDATAVAHEVHEVSMSLIPLMLRTDAYQEAVIRAHVKDRPRESVEEWLLLFKQAQGVLESFTRPSLTFVIDESALLRHVGSREVMYEQLTYLRSVAARRQLYVHVLPFPVPLLPGMLQSSTLLSWRERPEDDMYCVPMYGGEVRISRDPRRLTRARADFVQLLLHATASTELPEAVNEARTRL